MSPRSTSARRTLQQAGCEAKPYMKQRSFSKKKPFSKIQMGKKTKPAGYCCWSRKSADSILQGNYVLKTANVVLVEGTKNDQCQDVDVNSYYLSAARVEPQASALSTVQALLGTSYTQHTTSQLFSPSCLYYLVLQRSKNKGLGNERMDRLGRSRHVMLLSKEFSLLPTSTSCQHGSSEMLSM